MRDGGEDDGKRVFTDGKCVWSLGKRDVKFHGGWDFYLCGGGDSVDGSGGDGGVDGSRGSSGGGNSEENIVYRSGRVCGVFLG